jgi:predicted permease
VFAFQTIVDTAMQFGLFYGLIAIGFLFSRLSGRGKAVNKPLTSVLVNLLIPVLFIYTYLSSSLDATAEIPTIVAIALMIHLMGPLLMYLVLWKRNLDTSTKGVFYICVTFNNALFIPLPLVLMFIGTPGISIVVIYSLTQMMLLATVGSFMGAIYSGKASERSRALRETLTFPPFLAAIIALILYLAGLRLTGNLASILSLSAPLTTYLALISVGIGIGIKINMDEVRSSLKVVSIRQFLAPLILIPMILLSGLSHLPATILILESLMPPAVLTVVYATSFELDAERAATIVTVGTILLLPIIPFIPILLG